VEIVPVTEIDEIIKFPVTCIPGSRGGEETVADVEYRCFWDECNRKVTKAELKDGCKRKREAEGATIVDDKIDNGGKWVDEDKGPAEKTTTTSRPKIQGSDDYDQAIEEDEAESHSHSKRDANKDQGHDHNHGNKTKSGVAELNQLSIGLLAVLPMLL
ncbi:hypothetical protein PMAYCL1PPCAC_01138, partial [Pristionchus mayeri]